MVIIDVDPYSFMWFTHNLKKIVLIFLFAA
jgi:hypothetical protein